MGSANELPPAERLDPRFGDAYKAKLSAAALGSFCDFGAAAEEYQLRVVLSSESATLSGIRHRMHKPIPPALIWYNQDPT